MKNLIMIIDPQIDFISGSLAVKGAKEAIDTLIELIDISERDLDFGISLDLHPSNHCSFGEWPPHCIEHTYGAIVYPPLMKFLLDKKCNIRYFPKGRNKDKEEYSFWSYITNTFDKDLLPDIMKGLFSKYEYIYLAGIAGDYCVLESLKHLKPMHSKVKVLKDCVASIDGGIALVEYCKENNIEMI